MAHLPLYAVHPVAALGDILTPTRMHTPFSISLLYHHSIHAFRVRAGASCAGNCGHDFCRHCLTRWTTQQRRTYVRSVTCPVCRGVFASTAVQDLNVCIRLRDTIQLLFPEQLESRKAEVQQEVAEVAAAAAAVDVADAGGCE